MQNNLNKMNNFSKLVLGLLLINLLSCVNPKEKKETNISSNQTELQYLAKQSSKQNLLKVGDPAPSLKGAEWIKGEPIHEFKKGHVYVVDFGFVG